MGAFVSYFSDSYIQPPYEKMPYSACNGYVWALGIIHFIVFGVATIITVSMIFCIRNSTYLFQFHWLECLCILTLSFFFSVDLYCACSINSYMIRRHQHYKWERSPEEGIIQHITIRKRNNVAAESIPDPIPFET